MEEIEKAIERFTSREVEIPYDLHEDLTVIIEAARGYVRVLDAQRDD